MKLYEYTLEALVLKVLRDHSLIGVHISLLGLPGKIPQTGWLTQEKLIFSQFWKPKIGDQGAGSAGFFQGFSPWLVNDHVLPVSSLCLLSVTLCVLIPLLIRVSIMLD